MNDRLNPEALRTVADVILRHCGGYVDTTPADAERAAKAVLRNLAALSAPRTITTIAELEALPFETIVLDAEDDHMKRVSNGEGGAYWERFGDTWTYPAEDVCLPATVLHVPTEGGGES